MGSSGAMSYAAQGLLAVLMARVAITCRVKQRANTERVVVNIILVDLVLNSGRKVDAGSEQSMIADV